MHTDHRIINVHIIQQLTQCSTHVPTTGVNNFTTPSNVKTAFIRAITYFDICLLCIIKFHMLQMNLNKYLIQYSQQQSTYAPLFKNINIICVK